MNIHPSSLLYSPRAADDKHGDTTESLRSVGFLKDNPINEPSSAGRPSFETMLCQASCFCQRHVQC